MRLYGYLATEDELLDLMVDAIYVEIGAGGAIKGDWRAVLRSIAHRCAPPPPPIPGSPN